MRRQAREQKPQRRASLRELASITGYSTTTISMVLNGRAREFNISREACDLILSAVKEHDYHPNLHARSLRSRTTDILGLVVPTLHNPFFSEMAETFERLARSQRKLALITVTHHDPQEELAAIHYFLAQKVECVFTANVMALEEISDLCTRAGMRQILLDSQESAKHTVATDNHEAARALTRALLASLRAAGRPGRVYFVGGMADHRITQHRLAGFRAALQERGLRAGDDQFIPSAFEAESAYRAIRALFRARDDVGGILLNALPALEGLAQYFPEAPERCRAVHYGVYDFHPIMSLLADLRIAIVRQNPVRMMEKAYELFLGGREGERGQAHYIPHDLVATPAMRPFLPEKLRAARRRS